MPKKFDRCVKKVRKKSPNVNPYAVCRAAMKKKRKKRQTKRGLYLDKKRKAKKPGKRISASGRVYYESRANRSDKDRRRRI